MAGAPDLVPVQLTLGSSKGAVSDWVLWPVAGATEQELADFSASLCDDLGVPQQFRGAVAETIVAQVADWVANVPPLPPAAPPRRELIR